MAESSEDKYQGLGQLLFGLALTLLFFYMMAPFLVALLLGAVTAIIAYPLQARLHKRMPRFISAFLITLGVAAGILMPCIFVLYSGAYRLLGFASQYKFLKPESLDSILEQPYFRKIFSTVTHFFPIDRAWIRDQAQEFLGIFIEKISKGVAIFLAQMPGLLLGFLIVILSVYFFLVDGPRFLRFLMKLSPLPRTRSETLYNSFQKSCRGVVLGLFASAMAQGFLMGILFIITGLPNPIFIAVLTMIWGLVPVVGTTPIWLSAILYLFFTGQTVPSIIMLVGGIIITTIDNVIRPAVIKGQSEMHPLLALVSVFGAVHLVGPTGIFLGPIIAAVFVSFLQILTLAPEPTVSS